MCTSPNEVICHGIPDRRLLLDGDIVNLDVSLYFEGYHADLNETYYVGDKARSDPDSVRVVETARQCLDLAIRAVKPGVAVREFGNIIERRAREGGCGVVRAFCGHGIHRLFHCPPDVLHYARNKGVGTLKPGMTFTIEPMVTLGSHRDVTWPDGWTATTADGKKTAQFGTFSSSCSSSSPSSIHMLCVCADEGCRAYVASHGGRGRGADGEDARLPRRPCCTEHDSPRGHSDMSSCNYLKLVSSCVSRRDQGRQLIIH
ncbi:hypothetical protein VTK73DRAFT_1093 [Phialemonium thermophilum]|uniref:Methionine aminopeptidase n=1 Tax=Phialemonium thermophilum TaxID=223376 RepID=A0ABR3VTY7_9PEZI